MTGLISWIFLLCLVAGLGLAGVFLLRAYVSGQSPAELLFRPRAEPRLGVVEYANVDGKRRLLLVRRDDVEHLIMTGGPVDVVVETGIGEKPRRQTEPTLAAAPAASATVFTRPPRTFGTATAASGSSSES